MKRHVLFLLAACAVPCAMAQAPQPQNIYVPSDGRCADVHPGDKVHFSLTIDWAGNPRAVYGDLRMRPAGEVLMRTGGLPPADFRSLGGGGAGTRDTAQANVYHFVFTVPDEIYGGTYRGAGVTVQMADADSPSSPMYDVNVNRHTRKQVRAYCLNVVSTYGAGGTNRPVVTNFEPGAIEPKQQPQ